MARVSAWVLAVYEHIITFDREVQQIWSRKFNLASILFIINRYSFLISVQCFPVLYLFADDPKSCNAMLIINTITYVTISVSSSILIIVRTWAICGRPIWLLILLSTTTAGGIIIATVIDVSTSQAANIVSPLPLPYGGCIQEISLSTTIIKRLETSSAALNVLINVLVCSLTVIRTYNVRQLAQRAGIKPGLASMMIRSGSFYLFILAVVAIIDTIMVFNAESLILQVLLAFVITIQPILVNRIILSFREIDAIDSHLASRQGSVAGRVNSIDFMGNIGAPLDSNLLPADIDTSARGNNNGNEDDHVLQVTTRQLLENPLTIGILDEDLNPVRHSGNGAT